MPTESRTVPEELWSFFGSVAEDDRLWLILCCARQMDRDVMSFEKKHADQWLQIFLDPASERDAMRHFGKVLWMVAVLDFELSPLALSRMAAMQQHFIDQDEPDPNGRPSRLAEMAKETLRDKIPRLASIGNAWRDLRMHELDEASLWIYRDEMKQLDRAELMKTIGRLSS